MTSRVFGIFISLYEGDFVELKNDVEQKDSIDYVH